MVSKGKGGPRERKGGAQRRANLRTRTRRRAAHGQQVSAVSTGPNALARPFTERAKVALAPAGDRQPRGARLDHRGQRTKEEIIAA